MNGLPSKVKIGGIWWEVGDYDGNDTNDGCCIVSSTKILIRTGMSRERTLVALVHEIDHALLHQSGVSAILNDDKQEDGICDAISYGTVQFLRDNPAIMRMIQNGGKK